MFCEIMDYYIFILDLADSEKTKEKNIIIRFFSVLLTILFFLPFFYVGLYFLYMFNFLKISNADDYIYLFYFGLFLILSLSYCNFIQYTKENKTENYNDVPFLGVDINDAIKQSKEENKKIDDLEKRINKKLDDLEI